MKRGPISIGLALATCVVGTAWAGPAQAAAGVQGHIDTATITEVGYSCVGAPCNIYGTYASIHVIGWAYNPDTRPGQEVRFVVTGTWVVQTNKDPRGIYQDNYTTVTRTFRANDTRKDVAQKHNFSQSNLGYNQFYPTTPKNGHYSSLLPAKVCAQARDAGSSQDWRGASCVTVKPKTSDGT